MTHKLETMISCPACGQKYSAGSTKVVERKDEKWLIHMNCSKCKCSSLAIVADDGGGSKIVTMGMLTDLRAEEAAEKMRMDPITIDDALSLYESLKKHGINKK